MLSLLDAVSFLLRCVSLLLSLLLCVDVVGVASVDVCVVSAVAMLVV